LKLRWTNSTVESVMKKFFLSLLFASCAFAQPYSPTTTPYPYGLSEQDVVFRQNLVGRSGVSVSHSNSTTFIDGTGVAVTNVVLATNTFNVVNQYANTNWNTFNLNTIFVDGIAGNDNQPGTFDYPKQTLLGAQNVATNGQTICVLRGTFVANRLGKPGVDWYFTKGVVVDGGGLLDQGVFAIGKNNLVTPLGFELNVKGEGTFTNMLLNMSDATNATVNIDAYVISSLPSLYIMVTETSYLARSNVVRLKATREIAGNYFYSAASPFTYDTLDLTFNAPLLRLSAPSITFATNTTVTFEGGLLTTYPGAGGLFPLNSGGPTYRVNTARFSRGTAAMTSNPYCSTNTYFNQVVVLSSNADFSAMLFNNSKGTYRFVNP